MNTLYIGHNVGNTPTWTSAEIVSAYQETTGRRACTYTRSGVLGTYWNGAGQADYYLPARLIRHTSGVSCKPD